MNSFYICEPGNENVRGPFTESQLRGMWERGEVNLQTLMQDSSGFGNPDWEPAENYMWVFEAPEPIIRTQPTSPSRSSNSVNSGIYRVLAFFFGGMGVHDFYAGHILSGFAKIALTIFGVVVLEFHWFGVVVLGMNVLLILYDIVKGPDREGV